jgi:hypothetical protein
VIPFSFLFCVNPYFINDPFYLFVGSVAPYYSEQADQICRAFDIGHEREILGVSASLLEVLIALL